MSLTTPQSSTTPAETPPADELAVTSGVSWREAAAHFGRGILMGAADIVPGVSGGTVALIVGIYARLVAAISHVDRRWFALLKARRWRDAARHIDLPFLASLAPGILCGMALMTWWMHYLMTHPAWRPYTLSVFFGVILASALLVAGSIRLRDSSHAVRVALLGLLGAALALAVTRLRPGHVEPSLGYLFACGVIAITAMILPGISGAMVLLILGVYVYLTEIPHLVVHGEKVVDSLIIVCVFGSGCAVGLIGFSKLLRVLLDRYHALTMGFLCGLMLGSLVNIWPFQQDLTPEETDFKLKQFERIWPASFDGHVLGVVAIGILAAIAVWSADRLAWRLKTLRRSTSAA